MALALPTPDILRELDGLRVIECGAGRGAWLAILNLYGIDALGIDPEPHPGVARLDHTALCSFADRDVLLVVWPPDGTDLALWIDAWGGKRVAICGEFSRFSCPPIDVEYSEILPPGSKGPSQFILGRVA